MARSEITLGPAFKIAAYAAGAYIGAVGIFSLFAGLNCIDTHSLREFVEGDVTPHRDDSYPTLQSTFFEKAYEFYTEDGQCFYPMKEKQIEVGFEEWHGYRSINTFAWFFGLSQEPTYHALGTFPVFEEIRCDLAKDESTLNFGEYMQAMHDAYTAIKHGERYQEALKKVEGEGWFIVNETYIPQP